MTVENFPAPFRFPYVYSLFGTEGFLEKKAVSGLLMKPLKDFSAFNGAVQTSYVERNNLKVNRRNVIHLHTL